MRNYPNSKKKISLQIFERELPFHIDVDERKELWL